jgi:zinc transporter 1/2/3
LPIVKILLQLALTGFNVACWLIPLRSKSFAQNKNVLSIANAFSAGIFLMLGLGHLVPHSLEALDSISANRNLTFYALLGGYLMMLLIEKVAFNSHALLHSLECPGVVSHDHSHAHPEHAIKVSTSLPVADPLPQLPETCTLEHDHSLHTHDKTFDSQLRPGGGTLSPTSAIVLLVAMSVHSLFETLALGIAQDRLSATMMAISIGLHQPAESVALLVAFLKTSLPIEAIVKWLGLFSAVGMLGVCLGLLIS